MHGHNKSENVAQFPFPFAILKVELETRRGFLRAFSFFRPPTTVHRRPFTDHQTTGPNLDKAKRLHARRTPRHQAHGRPRRAGFHVSRRQRRHRSRKILRRQLSLRCSCAAWPAPIAHSGEVVLQFRKTPLYRISDHRRFPLERKAGGLHY